MKITSLGIMLLFVVATAGCAFAQPRETVDARLRLDELVALSQQGMSDDALIVQIEQRGVAFVLSQQDFEQQRAAGVSEGVLRYLQGRASAEQSLKAQILAGRYRVPAYYGPLYLGYPYLGYYSGHHYYGGGGGPHYGGHRGGHLGGHPGGHFGGGHHGGPH